MRHRSAKNDLRQNAKFSWPFRLILAVQSSLKKYFALPVGQIIFKSSPHPAPREGRFAIVTIRWCGMRWTFSVRKTNAREGGRQSRVVLMPRRWHQVCEIDLASDGDRKPDRRGEHEGNR
jgi:hypothetical protein